MLKFGLSNDDRRTKLPRLLCRVMVMYLELLPAAPQILKHVPSSAMYSEETVLQVLVSSQLPSAMAQR